MAAILQRIIPFQFVREKIIATTPWLKVLQEADFVGDIHGGDSFSDIYGMRRFLVGRLPDVIAILMKKDITLLPQTYGPYHHSLARRLAGFIISKSKNVLSRDKTGADVVGDLLNEEHEKRVVFCPDVAFYLDVVKVQDPVIIPSVPESTGKSVIGINVNGLMYNGGYSTDNMFGLKLNYSAFMKKLVLMFLKESTAHLLFVPHTFGPTGNVNSDPDASKAVISSVPMEYIDRVHLVDQEYDQSEIKGIISKCDFFVGSRMHACIAALSQGIPTIGVAYSRKFIGVFDSIGSGDTVLDARTIDEEFAVRSILDNYEKRDLLGVDVKKNVAAAQEMLLSLFQRILE